jgi:transglutaminase-like putative cysteine protease
MNFAINYLTSYRYDAEVTDNLNALRVRPASNARQRVEEFEVRVDPETRLHRHTDYFGTEVVEFGISEPHGHLSIEARARVSIDPPPEPQATPWEGISSDPYREAATEFLLLTDGVSDKALEEFIATARADTPLATVLGMSELVPDRFEYRKGATYVGSNVNDLLEGGAGVCQDFVHLTLAVLRRLCIAARYVSGYLFAAPADGGTESVEVDTHAWVEALLPGVNGNGPGWVAIDPTNRGLATERHVKIGHGRTYDDVPPIKGVYRGGARAELDSSVQMTLTEADDPATARLG